MDVFCLRTREDLYSLSIPKKQENPINSSNNRSRNIILIFMHTLDLQCFPFFLVLYIGKSYDIGIICIVHIHKRITFQLSAHDFFV